MTEMTEFKPQTLTDEQKLSTIAAEIRALTATALTTIIEIGRRMCAAKAMVKHGEWAGWLQQNTGYSSSTAENFMRIFNEYGADQISLFGDVEKPQTFGNLTYSKALALLSVPKSEREAFVQENNVDEMSTRELKEAIKAREAAEAARDTAEKERDIANAKAARALEAADKQLSAAQENMLKMDSEIQSMCQKIIELESRPVEVAVQRDEEAIKTAAADAKKKADAEWSKRVDKTTAELSQKTAQAQKLEKDLADVLKRLEEAEKAKTENPEKEAMLAHIAELEKKLKVSDAAATKVKLLLGQFQTAYRDLNAAIDAVEDQESAQKMRAAVQAQIGAWRDG